MELDGTGWNWMELDGIGWNWMELDGYIPLYTFPDDPEPNLSVYSSSDESMTHWLGVILICSRVESVFFTASELSDPSAQTAAAPGYVLSMIRWLCFICVSIGVLDGCCVCLCEVWM